MLRHQKNLPTLWEKNPLKAGSLIFASKSHICRPLSLTAFGRGAAIIHTHCSRYPSKSCCLKHRRRKLTSNANYGLHQVKGFAYLVTHNLRKCVMNLTLSITFCQRTYTEFGIITARSKASSLMTTTIMSYTRTVLNALCKLSCLVIMISL